MFQIKKKKIAQYIDSIPENRLTPFDLLLKDYLYGELNAKLEQMNISKLKYHIDWLDEYKCIEINGKCNQLFINIQIESTEFSVACDADEPDNCTSHALLEKEQFYQTIKNTVNEILRS